MAIAKVFFWASAGALVWTHAAYPLAARALARVRTRPVLADEDALPTVAVIVAAHDEEPVIERRVANLRELDYPSDRIEVVVTSDASTDRTEELAEAAGARVIRNPRGGKVAAQDSAVRQTQSDVVAFSDANCTWAPDALRKLVRSFADPDVAYVCGRLNLEPGRRQEQGGALLALRAGAARRRVAHRLRHRRQRLDLRGAARGLSRGRPALRPRPLVPVPDGAARPPRRVRAGGERVREGDADERGRVPPQGADVRALLGDRGRGEDAAAPAAALLRRGRVAPASPLRQRPAARRAARVDDRAAGRGPLYQVALGLQLGLLAAAAVGVGVARYYVLVTWATLEALVKYLRRGVPTTWEAAEGTR